jgi:isopropylmalate/homocitrate/citramalate synthase
MDPARFGLERRIMAGHRLVGRHAIRDRAASLGVRFDDTQLRAVTDEVKRRSDSAPLENDELDALIINWAVT